MKASMTMSPRDRAVGNRSIQPFGVLQNEIARPGRVREILEGGVLIAAIRPRPKGRADLGQADEPRSRVRAARSDTDRLTRDARSVTGQRSGSRRRRFGGELDAKTKHSGADRLQLLDRPLDVGFP